jgi:hypothetical protein
MSRYDALGNWLRVADGTEVTLSFGEIERVIGRPLPTSALQNRSWWGNTPRAPDAAAWMRDGWILSSVALPDGPVSAAMRSCA